MEKVEIMKIASLLCDNSTCLYKVGCIAVKNDKILLKAFNQTLPGEKYCQNGTCSRKELGLSKGSCPEIVCAIHAEASIVAQAANQGISLKGSQIFVTTFPCMICARLLVIAQIEKVYYMTNYTDENFSKTLFESANIKVEQIPGEKVWGDLWK